MEFCEKLDFLMKLTNTTNSALALYTKVDPSHISRLRRGQRNTLRNTGTIQLMAAYFTRNVKADYQRKALAEKMRIPGFEAEQGKLAAAVAVWLQEGRADEFTTVKSFLDGFSGHPPKKFSEDTVSYERTKGERPLSAVSVYFGVKGKQAAARAFLEEVLAAGGGQTLMLFSDEATDWMVEREFAREWAALMGQVLKKGNRITVIHTVSRDLDEMLHAIKQWLPLYMTGLIEPYFYPKKRDGLLKQTLFLSPGIAAVNSHSLGDSILDAANFFTKDAEITQALTAEFSEFLKRCRPLLQIYTAGERTVYSESLSRFEQGQGNLLLKTESLSLFTMGEEVLLKIYERYGKTDGKLLAFREQRIDFFEKNIKEYQVTEVIQMFHADKVKEGKIRVSFSEMLPDGAAYYRPQEYIQHLVDIEKRLRENENFHIHLIPEEESEYMVVVKEDYGAIVAKTSAPPIALVIWELNMVSAFWDYLRGVVGEKEYDSVSNEESAKRLRSYIDALNSHVKEDE